jgi:hypothetical protein
MTENVTSQAIAVQTPEGTTANVNPELFQGYVKESIRVLAEIAALQDEYKMIVATVAESTTMKKGLVSKYMKSRFKLETEKTKKLGIVFEQLDEALEA